MSLHPCRRALAAEHDALNELDVCERLATQLAEQLALVASRVEAAYRITDQHVAASHKRRTDPRFDRRVAVVVA